MIELLIGIAIGLFVGVTFMRDHKRETIGELLDQNIALRWELLAAKRDATE